MAACIAITATPAAATSDAASAAQLFAEAQAICTHDRGRLWGRSLCGPILLVNYTDRSVLANEADGEGHLAAEGAMFRGTLPEPVIIANTPTEWAGVRWTQIVAPLPADEPTRQVLVAHELFHRIQPVLKLTRPEAPNAHLDTLQGRILLQLEWRALAQALRATTATARHIAIADALLFRHERYRLFPSAASEEGALEINEGLAEYTGVRLGLSTPSDRIDYAIHDLSAFVPAPTFVRSFAYATGPSYGLLLDQADPGWRQQVGTGRRFDELLSDALGEAAHSRGSVEARAAVYDDGTLRASEARRDEERRSRLAALKERLVDGPVLTLPLRHANYQFNPQTLTPLEGFGTIYPTMRLTDDWGALEVERGGALVRPAIGTASVSIQGVTASQREGDGWRLTLKPGWTIRPGTRAGDLQVGCDAGC